MNKQHMLALADQVEKSQRFDMNDWFVTLDGGAIYLELVLDEKQNFCGTACCIAGEAALMSGETEGLADNVAKSWLDLTQWEAQYLFHGYWKDDGINLDAVTPKMAAAQIRKMVRESV